MLTSLLQFSDYPLLVCALFSNCHPSSVIVCVKQKAQQLLETAKKSARYLHLI